MKKYLGGPPTANQKKTAATGTSDDGRRHLVNV